MDITFIHECHNYIGCMDVTSKSDHTYIHDICVYRSLTIDGRVSCFVFVLSRHNGISPFLRTHKNGSMRGYAYIMSIQCMSYVGLRETAS